MRDLRVKLNNIFLSRSGSDFVEPCELSIPEYEQLQAVWVGTPSFTASGKATTTISPAAAIPFQIQVTKLYADTYQSLIDLAKENINAQVGLWDISTVAFPVEITGFTEDENLSFDACFNPANPYKRERFIDARSFNITFNLVKI